MRVRVSLAFILSVSVYHSLSGVCVSPSLFVFVCLSVCLFKKAECNEYTVKSTETDIYRQNTNLACGIAKGFSHPPTANMTSSISKLKGVLSILVILMRRHRGDF